MKPRGSPGVRWFLRLGPKQEGYHVGTASQVNASVFVPPQTVGLASARRRLRKVCFGFTDCTGTEQSDEEPEEEDDPEEVRVQLKEKYASLSQTRPEYPLLSHLGLEYESMTDTRVHNLVGELVRLQRSRAAAKSGDITNKSQVSTGFYFNQGESNYAAIPIPCHRNEEAFKSYIKKKTTCMRSSMQWASQVLNQSMIPQLEQNECYVTW